ncbi:hypothetical protein [Candidatus Nitrosocosmicus sp. R]
MRELEGEALVQIDAKIGGNSKRREILYSFIEPLNSLYLEKTEIYRTQIQACRKLTKQIRSSEDTQIIDNEISQLQLTLNLESP